MPQATISGPYRPSREWKRRMPVCTPAAWAEMSPSVFRGRRTLRRITFQTSRQRSPRAKILIAGRIRPSWYISVASPGIDPGAMPPTSVWCPRLATKPTSSSSQKTGAKTVTSGRCVPPA